MSGYLARKGPLLFFLSKPAADDRATADDETMQSDRKDDEYDYEDQSVPADQVKSTISSPKSTVLPYFDAKIVRRTVKPGGNITLECPVKNLAETNVILWFKEANTITNNLNVLDNAYQVAKQNFSLIIVNATESFAGNYFCEIAPQTIRMQTILKVSNETAPDVPAPPETPQVKEAAPANDSTGSSATKILFHTSLLVVSSMMIHSVASQRNSFQLLLTF